VYKLAKTKGSLYYVENIKQGKVGNCMLFWRENDYGYTCELREARKFELSELPSNTEKYKVWPCEYLDLFVSHHVSGDIVLSSIDDA